MSRFTVIAAIARDGVIGRRGGGLPWHLPEDLARFRRITLGKPLIMGRRTFEAIGRPLAGRRSVVITRDRSWSVEGAEAAASVDAAFERVAASPEAVIAGGGEVYAQTMERADRLRLTWIDGAFDGDVRFPCVDWRVWRESSSETLPAGSGRPALRFADYLRA